MKIKVEVEVPEMSEQCCYRCGWEGAGWCGLFDVRRGKGGEPCPACLAARKDGKE
jgi:hypothetical protein